MVFEIIILNGNEKKYLPQCQFKILYIVAKALFVSKSLTYSPFILLKSFTIHLYMCGVGDSIRTHCSTTI